MSKTMRHLMTIGFTVVLLLTVVFVAGADVPPVAAQGPVGSGPTVGHAVTTGQSPALRGHSSLPTKKGSARVVPLSREVKPQTTLRLPSRVNRDPVAQNSPGRVLMPSPIQSFEGTNDFNNYYPPDTNGDIGYNPSTGIKYYVQWVNAGYQVWDVTSTPTSVSGPVDANVLWAGLSGASPCKTLTTSSNGGDVIVLFDALAHRWLASAFAYDTGGPYHQCVALSKTADPTGQYWLYDFIVSSTMFNDYPKWAIWPDGYYLTVDQIGGSGGVGAFVFDRSKMLSGDVSASFQYFNLPNQSHMLPSNLNGPTLPPSGSPNYFVQLGYDPSGNPQSPLQVWQFHTDWAVTTNSSMTLLTTLAVAPFDANLCNFDEACIPEPAVSGEITQTLDALSDRLMYRLQYRNFGAYETMVVNHTVAAGDFADHAGVRWYEFRKYGGGAWSVYQQGTYAPDANHRWMGSIAMDGEGNIALGYSVSSTSVFPSIKYTGRLVNDPLNELPQGEGVIKDGAGAQTYTNRWGDYSSMSVDPVDDCTFWYTNEYYSAGGGDWQTRIGSFKLCAGNQPTRIYFFPIVLKNASLP